MPLFGPTKKQREVIARQAELKVRAELAASRPRPVVVQLRAGLYGASEPSRFRQDHREVNLGHVAVEFDEHEAERLRGASRWLWRHSGAYRAPILAATVEIMGSGLFPMGKTPLARIACDMFRRWGGDKTACDIRGMRTLPGLQRAELIDLFVDGDHGLILTNTGAVQPITADRIVSKTRMSETPREAGGITTDEVGRVTGYTVAPWDSRGMLLDRERAVTYSPQWFSFLNCPDVAEAIRTPPLMIAAIDRIQDVEEFIDNTMTASKWASAVSGFMTSEDPPAAQGMLEGASADATNGATNTNDSSRQNEITLEAGTFFNAGPNAKIEQIDAKHPNAQFEAFIGQILRVACASIRLPYEVAMQDFSGANFSTARAIRMQAEEFAAPWRRMYIEHRLMMIYRWKVRQWQGAGLLPVGEAATADLLAVEVPPPPRHLLDEQKERAAQILAINAGLDTRERILRSEGKDPDAVRRQREKELSEDRTMGVQPQPMGEGSPGVPRTSGGGADNEDERLDDMIAERLRLNGAAN